MATDVADWFFRIVWGWGGLTIGFIAGCVWTVAVATGRDERGCPP